MGDDIVRVPVKGTWARQVAVGAEPLAAYPRPTPGRFHREGDVALYLADRADIAWTEWYRALAARGVEPNDEVPRDLWSVSVDLEEVVDLRSAAVRARAGLPSRVRPAETQWQAFQGFAAQTRERGVQGIVYASAARTRSLCLCVFPAGLDGLSVGAEPLRVIAPPPPPRGLRT